MCDAPTDSRTYTYSYTVRTAVASALQLEYPLSPRILKERDRQRKKFKLAPPWSLHTENLIQSISPSYVPPIEGRWFKLLPVCPSQVSCQQQQQPTPEGPAINDSTTSLNQHMSGPVAINTAVAGEGGASSTTFLTVDPEQQDEQQHHQGVAHAAEANDPSQDAEAMASVVEDVQELIPICAQHPTGPQQTTATFGYDIAQMKNRPWAQPGAKRSDYFNYGFNEQSWRLYCQLQDKGRESLLARANEVLQELNMVAQQQQQQQQQNMEMAGGYPPGALPYGAEGLGPMPYGAYGPEGGAPPPGHHHGGPPPGHHMGGSGSSSRRGAQEYGTPHPHEGGPQPRLGRLGDSGPSSHQNNRYKTQLCQRFLEGRCTHGSACNYAHGEGELRQSAPGMHMGGGGGGGGGGGRGYGGEGGGGGGGYRGKRSRMEYDGHHMGPPQHLQQPPQL
eukprot:gene8797-6183_t